MKTIGIGTRPLARVVCLLGLASFPALVGCGSTRAVDSFMLIFPVASNNTLAARWLNRSTGQWDGTGAQPPPGAHGDGVGGAGGEGSLLSILSWTANAQLYFAWGIGAIFDQHYVATMSQQIAASAPVVVGAPDSSGWLLAFRTTGNTVALRHYNTDTQSFTDFDYAPTQGAGNDNADGRPALARLATKVVLAWQRGSEIRVAVGTVDHHGKPTSWDQKFGLSFPNDNRGCYGNPREPALTAAGGQFYLAIRRSTVRCPSDTGTFLSRDDVFLFASPDGTTWQPNQPVGVRGNVVIPFATIGLAGWTDGTILLGVVSTGTNKYELYKYRNGTWTTLSAPQVFGTAPAPGRPFALYSYAWFMDSNATPAPF